MLDYEDDDDDGPDLKSRGRIIKCSDAIFSAVGEQSPRNLTAAMEDSCANDALMRLANDPHNPIALAAESGDERLLAVFQSFGIKVDGWYGSTGNNLFHAMAERRAPETEDAEQWLVERQAGYLVSCPNRKGIFPLELLIEHNRGDAAGLEQVKRWVALHQQAGDNAFPARKPEAMFGTLSRIYSLAHNLSTERLLGDSLDNEPMDLANLWLAFPKRKIAWSDDLAHALVQAGVDPPESLLVDWMDAGPNPNSVWNKSDLPSPNTGSMALKWLLNHAPKINPCSLNEDGLTPMEAGLQRRSTHTAGWQTGTSYSMALFEAYGPTYGIEALAPRLPEILVQSILKDTLNAIGPKTLEKLWKLAGQFPENELLPFSPANCSIQKAKSIKLKGDELAAALEQVDILIHLPKLQLKSGRAMRL